MAKQTVVSLFSGCGGLDLGFLSTGFEIAYACDIDAAAVDCYRRNIDATAVQRDVTTLDFKDELRKIKHVDVVLGGFPCQGFSKSGPKKLYDVRNRLYVEMKDAVDILKPAVFVAENVDGLSQNFGGRYLRAIRSDFANVGYDVQYRILNAAHFGVAQHRRRIIFIGLRIGGNSKVVWPEPTHHTPSRNGEAEIYQKYPLFDVARQRSQALTIRDAIGDLSRVAAGTVADHRVVRRWPEKYAHIMKSIGPGQKLCNVRFARTSVYTWNVPAAFGKVTERQIRILEAIGKNRRHRRYGKIPNGNPLPIDEIQRLSGLKGIQKDIDALLTMGYLKERSNMYDLKGAMFCSGLFKRPDWDAPSPTVLTNFHNPRYFLHPSEDRPFTLRECARLQGFPDRFIFSTDDSDRQLIDGYRLVGNAVPPPLATALGQTVAEILSTSSRFAA